MAALAIYLWHRVRVPAIRLSRVSAFAPEPAGAGAALWAGLCDQLRTQLRSQMVLSCPPALCLGFSV